MKVVLTRDEYETLQRSIAFETQREPMAIDDIPAAWLPGLVVRAGGGRQAYIPVQVEDEP